MSNTNKIETPVVYGLALTKPEIEALLGLLDLGVKNGGLAVAASAAVLNQKIQAAKPLFEGPDPRIPTADPTK